MAFSISEAEVIICGGGPVGLLVAYGLQKFGVSTCLIEKDVKSEMPMYGRACTLYPRSLELLESYGLLHEMTNIGVISRGSITYKNGMRVTTRGWGSMFSQMGESFLDYVLNLRLKYSEEVFAAAYESLGGKVYAGWEVNDIKINPTAEHGYRVSVQAKNVSTGESHSVQSKYIVGTDGGRSIVRRTALIDMPATGSEYHWVRIDGVIESNMPDATIGSGSVESPSHGNVLFVRLDHGRSRIGFALNAMLYEKYGGKIGKEDAMYEAQQAMLPFTCEFKGDPDWFTSYSIRQAVAETFVKDNCVVIAGDAAHVHSSAAAQGMNTGIHDATNLAWKLAGVVRGLFSPAVLETYDSERRVIAANLIRLDKQFSAVISGDVPADMASLGEDPNELLSRIFQDSMQFNIGLGITYPANVLNKSPYSSMLVPGQRAPDKVLHAPGSTIPVRLQTITSTQKIQFNILVFAGEPLLTQQRIHAFRKYLDESPVSIAKSYRHDAFRFLTIIAGNKSDAQGSLGCRRFGDIWFDRDSHCHYAFGFTPEIGGIAVVRPDGVFGFATPLDEGERLSEYFGQFLTTSKEGNTVSDDRAVY